MGALSVAEDYEQIEIPGLKLGKPSRLTFLLHPSRYVGKLCALCKTPLQVGQEVTGDWRFPVPVHHQCPEDETGPLPDPPLFD